MRFLEFAPEIRDTIFEAIAVVTTVESIAHISNRLSCNTFRMVENTAFSRQNVALERKGIAQFTCQSKEYFIATEKKALHMWSFPSDKRHLSRLFSLKAIKGPSKI